jgi:hypothetical protein
MNNFGSVVCAQRGIKLNLGVIDWRKNWGLGVKPILLFLGIYRGGGGGACFESQMTRYSLPPRPKLSTKMVDTLKFGLITHISARRNSESLWIAIL